MNRKINKFLKDLNYLSEGQRVSLHMSGSIYKSTLNEINNWITSNPDEVNRLLQEKSIHILKPSANPNETWGLWKKNVNIRPSLLGGNILDFNSSTTIDELISVLKEN